MDRTDEDRATALLSWIESERQSLFYDFEAASRRALRTPNPRSPEHWSMEMLNLAERIREADGLLGNVAAWDTIQWTAWPYFEAVSGSPVPDEAWVWLEAYGQREGHQGSVRWTLQFRPAAA